MIGSKSMLTKRILMMSKAAFRVSLVAQTVKNPPATQETQVQFLGPEDPLEKGMATHSSTGRIPRTEEPGGLQSMESQRAGHDWGADKAVFRARQPDKDFPSWWTRGPKMLSARPGSPPCSLPHRLQSAFDISELSNVLFTCGFSSVVCTDTKVNWARLDGLSSSSLLPRRAHGWCPGSNFYKKQIKGMISITI